MDALPLTRHDWHGDWNYTLRPEAYDQVSNDPYPFGQPSPDLAWLCHPALTGLSGPEWDTLITTLMALHDQQREASLDARRGHRPRRAAPGTGRRPVLTQAPPPGAGTVQEDGGGAGGQGGPDRNQGDLPAGHPAHHEESTVRACRSLTRCLDL